MTKIPDLVDKAYQEALGYGEDVEASDSVRKFALVYDKLKAI